MIRHHKTRSLLAAADGLIAFVMTSTAIILANQGTMLHSSAGPILKMRITLLDAAFIVVFALVWQQCMQAVGMYKRFFYLARAIVPAAVGAAIMTALLALYLAIEHSEASTGAISVLFFLAGFTYEILNAFLSNPRIRWLTPDPDFVVILGSGRRAAKAWRELRTRNHGTKVLLGFFDDRDADLMAPDIAGRLLGKVDDLENYILRYAVDELVIAAPFRSCYDLTQRAVEIAEASGVRVVCLNDVYSLLHDKKLRARAPAFLELVPKDETHLVAEALKRTADVVLSAGGLVLLAPLLIAIAATVKLSSAGPVFFSEERYGLTRRRFKIWKFRTMQRDAQELMAALEDQNEAKGPIFKMKNDPRVTQLGRFLRKTSLDELPQLWNVLRGEMSLVGPRPMSVTDVARLSDAKLMRRFSVRPGITGIASAATCGCFNFDQWIAADLAYVENWSLAEDLKLLARKTIPRFAPENPCTQNCGSASTFGSGLATLES